MSIYAQNFTSTKVAPYVYRLDNTETGEFYIGYRCANKAPSSDDLGKQYFTSSKIVKPRFHEFIISIIAEFFDKEDALKFEVELIGQHWKQEGSLNYGNCGINFSSIGEGRITSEETKENYLFLKKESSNQKKQKYPNQPKEK